jgi:hypothetical protein
MRSAHVGAALVVLGVAVEVCGAGVEEGVAEGVGRELPAEGVLAEVAAVEPSAGRFAEQAPGRVSRDAAAAARARRGRSGAEVICSNLARRGCSTRSGPGDSARTVSGTIDP